MINYGRNEELYRNYGATEINGLENGSKYHEIKRETVFFDEITSKDKVVLERLRMVTDSGFPFYDISYIHITFNGKKAELYNFPTMQLNKRKWKEEIINICRNNNVFIKDIVNPIKVSILR